MMISRFFISYSATLFFAIDALAIDGLSSQLNTTGRSSSEPRGLVTCYSPHDANFFVEGFLPRIPRSQICMTSWVKADSTFRFFHGPVNFYADPSHWEWVPNVSPKLPLGTAFASAISEDGEPAPSLASKPFACVFHVASCIWVIKQGWQIS